MKREISYRQEIVQILLEQGHPRAFCDLIAGKFDDEVRARKMIDYLSHKRKASENDIVEKMISVLCE